jgi:HEAT repeat protein
VGWLKQVGISAIGDKVYAFSHPTFQEYFAAQAVTDGLFFVGEFPIYKWQEVVLLWLGREDIPDSAKENLLRTLETFDDRVGGFYSYRTYFLAAEGLAEFPQYIHGASLVAQLVQWRFGHVEPTLPATLVERAGIALSRSARSLTVPALENFLQTATDPLKRWLAAHSLGKNHDPGNRLAIATLQALLNQAPNDYLKIDIAKSLGTIDTGNELAIATLIELISTSQHPTLQRRAAQRLGKIDPGNVFALQTLERLVQETTDPHLRTMIVETLAQLTSQASPSNTFKKRSRRSKHQNPQQLAPEQLIAILVTKIGTTRDPLGQLRLAYRIAQLDLSHPLGIDRLVQKLAASSSKTEIKQAAEFLRELVAIDRLPQILPTVRDLYLSPSNPVQYQECFKLLWYWSRLLSYQEFSRLWSSQLPDPDR